MTAGQPAPPVGRPADAAEVVGERLDGQPAPPVGRPANDAEVVGEQLASQPAPLVICCVGGGE